MSTCLTSDAEQLVLAVDLCAGTRVFEGHPFLLQDRPPDPARLQAWRAARATWLQSLASPHTRRAYALAWTQFFEYVTNYFGIPPWRVETAHVRAWREHLEAEGKRPATVQQRLSAVSSFFRCIIREGQRGHVALYCDTQGCPRPNPFTTDYLDRPKVQHYVNAHPLDRQTARAMMGRINIDTPTGARDYALLLTFFYTGWRSRQVLTMRWGDIQEAEGEGGEHIFVWRNGEGEEQRSVLPAKCYRAIVHYLTLTGRWQPDGPEALASDMYIWQPLSSRGCANFPNVGELSKNRPISGTQANNILRKRLRAVGVQDAKSYNSGSLRHTFACSYVEATGGDVAGLSKHLQHANLAVTKAYLRGLSAAANDHSEVLGEILGF